MTIEYDFSKARLQKNSCDYYKNISDKEKIEKIKKFQKRTLNIPDNKKEKHKFYFTNIYLKKIYGKKFN